MSPIDEVEELLNLNRNCDLHWSGHTLRASFRTQRLQLEILHRLNDGDHVEIEVRQGGRVATLPAVTIGQDIDLSITPPRGASLCLAKDQEDLLNVFRLHCLPANFALMDSGFRTWAPSTEIAEPSVIAASALIKKFEQEEIVEAAGSRFALLTYDQKIYMTHKVSAETVERTAQTVSKGLLKLEAMLADTLHSAEKKRIIRNALISSLKSCDEDDRLSHLLRHCDEILENAQRNYELFISGFSFNNDLDKLLEQKRDFSVKLNGLLIGIQGKLLAIPVSTILATTQLKDPSDANHVTINVAVLASSIIFFIIIAWLIQSQMIAINSIKSEILQKEKRFRLELPKLFKEVRLIFASLISGCDLNLKMARFLIALSLALTAITFYVFWINTPSFGLWLSPVVIQIFKYRPWTVVIMAVLQPALSLDGALAWLAVVSYLTKQLCSTKFAH